MSSLVIASESAVAGAPAGGCGHDHRVEFYDSTEFLVDSVTDFTGTALRDGDAAIVVATEAHRSAFEAALRRSGIDIDAAVAEDRYLAFDAGEKLASFMISGMPDAGRFAEMAGAVIERATAQGRRVRVYGEMVALLWDAGDVASAITLEDLWNDLAGVHHFELLCAYPMSAFEDAASAAAFKRICDQHSTVIPSEQYSLLDDANARARVVAQLQQEVAALRAEVARLNAEQEIVAELAAEPRALTGVAGPEAGTWVGRLRRTLGEDRLVLNGRPIVSLTGGAVREDLLLQMVTRDGTLVDTEAFLPAARKFGLSAEIDRWIIARAVRFAALGRIVHVHPSAPPVDHPRLLRVIESELRAVLAPAANVIFELSATALQADGAAGQAFAEGLRELGCGLALADFRTGSGSFTYLQRLPFQSLRIDVELVRELPDNIANQHLVRAIVKLARSIDCETIADGVQDAQTLSLLRQYGIDYAEGDHIRHPGTAPQPRASREPGTAGAPARAEAVSLSR